MNALEIIEQVRVHNAELCLDGEGLVIRGKGARLPIELREAIREQKAAVMVALGAPHDAAVAAILQDVRPFLPPAIQKISDANLLILVNWAILHAWGRTVGAVQR